MTEDLQDLSPVPPPERAGGWVRSLLWTVLLSVALVMALGALRGGPIAGDNVPPLRGVDLAGQAVDLATLRGKPVVLYFWATWCSACKLTSPTVNAYAAAHPEVVVLGVAMEDAAAVQLYLGEHKRHFRVLAASEQVQRDWPVRALPTTVVLDANGRLTWQRQGVLLPGELNLHVD